jgi:hypothetical protein
VLLKLVDAGSAERAAASALEAERLGDDADGEDAAVARRLGDDGAAPVPVPPPMPAAMKHMWAPSSACSISMIASSAAALPISGREPAPRPWVI